MNGIYSGFQARQIGSALTLTPTGGSYAHFGVGQGNVSDGQHVHLTFASTGNLSWEGQFVGGCAAIFISVGRLNMQLLRNDRGPTEWDGG